MRLSFATFLRIMVFAPIAFSHASAEDIKPDPDRVYDYIPGAVIAEFQQQAENSSIIWLKRPSEKKYTQTDVNLLARQILGNAYVDAQGGDKFLAENVGNFNELGALSLRIPPGLARARIAEEKLSSDVLAVSPNSLIFGMGSECGDEDDQKAISTSEALPVNIERVNPSPENTYSGTKKVWLIDSGIADGADISSELNIVEQRLCAVNCVLETTRVDAVGHGTMIAGIIGAKKGNNLELIGVAPGVPIISLRIYTTSYPVDLLSNALTALQYIKTQLTSTPSSDVINVSFGAYYNPLDVPGLAPGTYVPSPQSQIESLLRELARDQKAFISVAAGNTDVIGGSGYVQTISPARAGGYRNPTSGTATGAVVTVSAVKSRKLTSGNWRDIFWKFSAYGNGNIIPTTPPRQMGPPDFAAPGVKIRSLWPPSSDNPKGQTNFCSGTSFAAAHVSGLLAYGIPITDQFAKFDPSALKPGKPPDSTTASDYVDAFRDPIAHK